MRIKCLITVGFFLISTAISEIDVPNRNTSVQRVPRALVLQPVIKVKSKDDEDEGPFDFIADWISQMMHPLPKKPATQTSPMIGPIKVAGLNDDLFIKQLDAIPYRNSHVMIRVMPKNKHPLMPLNQNNYQYTNGYQNAYNPMGNSYQMQSNFVPISTPMPITPIPNQMPMWNPAHAHGHGAHPYPHSHLQPQPHANLYPHQNYHQHQYQYQYPHSPGGIPPRNNYNNYGNQLSNSYRNNPGFTANHLPQQNYYKQNYFNNQRYPHHATPHPSSLPYNPYNSHYYKQNAYGAYDYHNSVGETGDHKGSNYETDSLKSINYPEPSIKEHSSEDNGPIEENQTINDEETHNLDESKEIKEAESIKHSKIASSSSSSSPPPSSSSSVNNVYRSDRMVSSSHKNRWKPLKSSKHSISTTAVSTKVEVTSDENKSVDNTKKSKYSSREIEEIQAPVLKTWSDNVDDKSVEDVKNKNSDSRMDNNENDDDGMMMKDGTTLGKGESQDYVKRSYSRINLSNKRHWKPSSTSISPIMKKQNVNNLIEKDKKEVKKGNNNSTRIENATPEVLQKVMNSAVNANNLWRHQDSSENANKRKLGTSNKNKKKVRIVESVRKSVSMTSSRGKKINAKS